MLNHVKVRFLMWVFIIFRWKLFEVIAGRGQWNNGRWRLKLRNGTSRVGWRKKNQNVSFKTFSHRNAVWLSWLEQSLHQSTFILSRGLTFFCFQGATNVLVERECNESCLAYWFDGNSVESDFAKGLDVHKTIVNRSFGLSKVQSECTSRKRLVQASN